MFVSVCNFFSISCNFPGRPQNSPKTIKYRRKQSKIAKGNQKSSKLITYVPDRPGHDYRYSIDYRLIKDKLKWKPDTSLEIGIEKTLDWYLNNQLWCKEIVGRSKYNLQRHGI